MDSSPDWLAIVLAAVFNMAIGVVWYSKWLFRSACVKLMDKKDKPKKGAKPVVFGFLVSLVIAYFLDFFQRHLGITTVSDGMYLGFCLWLGFVATTQISHVVWCHRPWQLFAINTGYKLVSFLVMSGIIGA